MHRFPGRGVLPARRQPVDSLRSARGLMTSETVKGSVARGAHKSALRGKVYTVAICFLPLYTPRLLAERLASDHA